MSESRREELIESFRDKEYRESYAEDYLNTTIATQLRVIREQRGLTQARLAEAIGTKQTAISRIENVNNTARNLGTLQAIAFKLGCRLKVSFESFGSLIDESLQFSRESLQRPSFEEDPVLLGTAPTLFLGAGGNAHVSRVNVFGQPFGANIHACWENVGTVNVGITSVPLGVIAQGMACDLVSMSEVSPASSPFSANRFADVSRAVINTALRKSQRVEPKPPDQPIPLAA